ncbi:MAG: calcium/sodium antiporter [Nitrospirae bacterium]|nr:calcium/sodium antiporter [Nitrospirota bacterium]
MPFKDFIIFFISLAVIIKSADLFTSGTAGLAEALRIPRMIIGLTIVSLATSAPEFTVSTFSAYMSRLPAEGSAGGMAVGNALGSCIANIGLVLGLAAMVRTIHFQPKLIKIELKFLIGIIVFLFLLMLDFRRGPGGLLKGGTLGFGDGILLNILLIGSFFYIVKRELKIRSKLLQDGSPPLSMKKDLLKFSIGAIGVIASAKYGIIPSGLNIAHFLKVPEVVIGLSMVAVGTSLPELFTALVAASKNMGDIAAGTVIGSNIANILWVLGASSLINPLPIDSQTLTVTMPVMLFLTVIMLIFAKRGFRLVRREGALLFLVYLGYLFYLFKFAY